MIPIQIKFIIAILWDVADFTIGRIPAFGTIFDFGGLLLALLLWGVPGILAGWEILDPTDQIDGFVPSVTVAGIISTQVRLNK